MTLLRKRGVTRNSCRRLLLRETWAKSRPSKNFKSGGTGRARGCRRKRRAEAHKEIVRRLEQEKGKRRRAEGRVEAAEERERVEEPGKPVEVEVGLVKVKARAVAKRRLSRLRRVEEVEILSDSC